MVVCSDFGESGQEITLKPNIRGKPQEILWKHNGRMIVEYDESEMMVYGSFKGRVVLDFETGQLTVRNLNIHDSGQFQSDILINGKIQSFGQNVTVLGECSTAYTLTHSKYISLLLSSLKKYETNSISVHHAQYFGADTMQKWQSC